MTIHVCTGKSGLGKSAAIIRPLRWLCLNEPPPGEYRRWGSAETIVTACFHEYNHRLIMLDVKNFQCHEDVHITFESTSDMAPGEVTCILRVRSDKVNEYRIHGPSSVATYKIGKDRKVPEPVAKYLNMSSINFAGQYDLPYLLGMNRTPFDLARLLNSLANMEDVDTAFSKINTKVRGEQGDVKKAQEEVDRLSKEVDRYKELGELEEYMGLVEAMEADRMEGERQAKMLRDYYTKLQKIEDMQMVYRGLNKIRDDIQVTLNKVKAIRVDLDNTEGLVRTTRASVFHIESLMDHIQRLYSEIQVLHDEAGKEKGLLGVCPVCERPFEEAEEKDTGGGVKKG